MTSFYEELRKNDSIGDEKENEQSRKSVDKWIFRLLLFLIGFMPLVVLANVEEVVSPLISNLDILSSGMKGDLFTHYKALLVILVTVITGLMLLTKVLFMGGTIRKTKLNYVLVIFVAAIVISTIASPNVTIALNGQYNRSDGAISWLCYIALMFIAMNIKYPKNIVRFIVYTMIPFVYINFYIITMNFYWKDLLQKEWMQKLVSIVLPEGANISTGSQLVGTLNQWNYMSGMFAMMTVMYLVWAIIEKSWVHRIIGAVTASISILTMFLSLSNSGFLTLVVCLIAIFILILKSTNKLQILVVLMIFITITAPVFHIFSEKNHRVWEESIGFFVKYNPYIKDEPVSFNEQDGNFRFNIFSEVYASDNAFDLPVLPQSGMSLGSGRAYIWSSALQLVEQRPLLGYGLDSLTYNFPHFQLESRAGLGSETTITDKPHSLYIGVLYGTGIIGFFMLLVLLIIQVLAVIKELLSKKGNVAILLIGITATAYFIQAMFNDSLPAVTTIAFIFVGIMYSHLDESKRELTE